MGIKKTSINSGIELLSMGIQKASINSGTELFSSVVARALKSPLSAKPSAVAHPARLCKFLLQIWQTLGCKLALTIPQTQWSMIRSGSQPVNVNQRCCNDFCCSLFLSGVFCLAE